MDINFDNERLFFNKWEMYKLLSSEYLSCNLPFTKELSEQSLMEFIDEGTPFLIKPIGGWGGKHISIISKIRERYLVEKQGHIMRYFNDKRKLANLLIADYNGKHYIIQKKAPILTYHYRPFDIRVHLQLNAHNKWIYAGDLIRVGGDMSIVSNVFISNGGVTESTSFLKNLFKSNPKVKEIKNSLEKVSFQIANILDKYYSFIDIGADFGVDKDGRLWLIEVNTDDFNGRPDYDLFKMLPDKSIYQQMDQRDKERNQKWFSDALNAYYEEKGES